MYIFVAIFIDTEKHTIMVNDMSSVHDEQFDGENKPIESNGESSTSEETINGNEELKSDEKDFTEDGNKVEEANEAVEDFPAEEKKNDQEPVIADDTGDEVKTEESEKEETEDRILQLPEKDDDESEDVVETETAEKEEITDDNEVDTVGGAESELKEGIEKDDENAEDSSPVEEEKKVEKIDYAVLGKIELVNVLDNLLLTSSAEAVQEDVDQIKSLFYKKHKGEVEELKKKFLDEGGKPEDFLPNPDEQEERFKALLTKHRDMRAELNRQLEEEKKENLNKKHQVIEEIKDLVNRKESINKTFHDFRELQQQWRDIGLVPQSYVKDLWESYHLACEMFYDYININKELRDLDLKKNMESKIQLCEKAEKLLLEPSVVNAFKILQQYHDQWREIGPVPLDQKTELWERFKEITAKINKRHHQHFEGLKENQKNNLEEKMVLCEKVEELNQMEISSPKEWEDKSKEIIEIQKVWKTIGFAPKKENNKIYGRFREACDVFFNKKREFFAQNKELQKNNLQLKTDLCVQAEALKESTDWKNTTETLIDLQKRWKKIGSVPRKYSDQVWDRFRSACDAFFERKNSFFSNKDVSYDENLKKKLELIEKIENYKIVESVEENFNNINAFQKEWSEIGFVPIEKKEDIQDKYRNAVNRVFDELKVDEGKRNLLKFGNKLNDMLAKPNTGQKMRQERDKLIKKLNALENDIVVWENNIGFFSSSKNADTLIKDVKSKIDNGKKSIEMLKQKIRKMDEFIDENNID